jgi:hypothetical protein
MCAFVRMPMPDTASNSSPTIVERDNAILWRSALKYAGVAYLFSRLAIMVGAAIVAAELRADENKIKERLVWGFLGKVDPHSRSGSLPKSAGSMILDVLTSWDGLWYLRIVRFGYPSFVPQNITYNDTEARLAFFPAFPHLVRIVDAVLPGGDTLAALILNLVLGAGFIVLVGLLARSWFGISVAKRAMILCALFPGSFVLSFAYSEALLLFLAAACLYLLQKEQWLLAGVVALFATATRPNGIAVIAACAVAAYLAWRQTKSLKPFIAPLLSPIGFIGYQLWINNHADESQVWFRVQGEAWKEGASFGLTAIRRTLEAFTQPLTSPTDLITAASFVLTLFLLWLVWKRHHIPLPALAYSIVIVALMLLPATVTARPRFLFTAFPLFIAAAVWLDHPKRKEWWAYLVGLFMCGLTALTALYGVYGAIP